MKNTNKVYYDKWKGGIKVNNGNDGNHYNETT